ncbi:MAG: glycoside hydrolase family 57 protein, partial [Muribaculaceae bacterium]|nr:glycoside hydrolase family 57 protein [Muribaculaceae bacterium]
MKAISFYFQIHQPFRLKRYRFFDIGNDHYYYDDFLNEDIITRIAERAYIPAAQTLLRMIENSNGAFRCAISITGVAIEQFEQHMPEFIDLLKRLADTGKVEFLAETYAHSLASLASPEEFAEQVRVHDEKLKTLFGVKPKVFRNTELIYSDDIAPQVYAMGYKGVITEGAKHILGWKSPNYVYSAATAPKLKILLKNAKLSDDISFRFGDTSWDAYPLTADKYIDWIANTPKEDQVLNLSMGLETFGELQSQQTGILQFLEALPRFAAEKGIEFCTPSEVIAKLKPVGELSIPTPISRADEARDTSAWLGNKLQNEAFNKLYSVAERLRLSEDR